MSNALGNYLLAAKCVVHASKKKGERERKLHFPSWKRKTEEENVRKEDEKKRKRKKKRAGAEGSKKENPFLLRISQASFGRNGWEGGEEEEEDDPLVCLSACLSRKYIRKTKKDWAAAAAQVSLFFLSLSLLFSFSLTLSRYTCAPRRIPTSFCGLCLHPFFLLLSSASSPLFFLFFSLSLFFVFLYLSIFFFFLLLFSLLLQLLVFLPFLSLRFDLYRAVLAWHQVFITPFFLPPLLFFNCNDHETHFSPCAIPPTEQPTPALILEV